MADISIMGALGAAGAAGGVIGGIAGALAAVYARGERGGLQKAEIATLGKTIACADERLDKLEARASEEGKRDEVVAGHERRLNAMRERMMKLETAQADDRAKAGERFARLEGKVDAAKEAAVETRDLVRELIKGKSRS